MTLRLNWKKGHGVKMTNKKDIFNFKYLPMDIGRIVYFIFPLLVRLKKIYVSQKAKETLKGGAIIVANHISFSDPFVVASVYPLRRVFFLAAEVLMRNPVMRALLKGMGCIKIDRSISDIEAVKNTVNLLKKGHMVSMFPQGGIDRERDAEEIKSGSVLMALQAGVPIIPAYIKKKKHWYNRQCIYIGESFECKSFCAKKIPTVSEIDNASKALFEKMEELRTMGEDKYDY